MGNDLEKSRQLWNCPVSGKWFGKIWRVLKPPENGKRSRKIQAVLKPSGKGKMIWTNLDSFETVRKIWKDMNNSGQFWNRPENGKRSGKIRTVLTPLENGKLSGKIWTVVKMSGKGGNDLEKSGWFWNVRKSERIWNNPDSLSGFSVMCTKNFWTNQNKSW